MKKKIKYLLLALDQNVKKTSAIVVEWYPILYLLFE